MKTKVCGVIGLGISVLMVVGLYSFLAACGPKEDGGWMMCHYVQNVLLLLGACLVLLHVLAVVFPQKTKIAAGLLIAGIMFFTCSIVIPDHVIHMCMMETMRCHTVMQPGVMVISILGILADLTGVVFSITTQTAQK